MAHFSNNDCEESLINSIGGGCRVFKVAWVTEC